MTHGPRCVCVCVCWSARGLPSFFFAKIFVSVSHVNINPCEMYYNGSIALHTREEEIG